MFLPSGLHLRPANFLQCLLAQNIRIALTGSGEFDELGGNRLFHIVVAVSSSQSNAGHFERNTQDAPSLGVELLPLQKGG